MVYSKGRLKILKKLERFMKSKLEAQEGFGKKNWALERLQSILNKSGKKERPLLINDLRRSSEFKGVLALYTDELDDWYALMILMFKTELALAREELSTHRIRPWKEETEMSTLKLGESLEEECLFCDTKKEVMISFDDGDHVCKECLANPDWLGEVLVKPDQAVVFCSEKVGKPPFWFAFEPVKEMREDTDRMSAWIVKLPFLVEYEDNVRNSMLICRVAWMENEEENEAFLNRALKAAVKLSEEEKEAEHVLWVMEMARASSEAE
jgi:hypothetical protein